VLASTVVGFAYVRLYFGADLTDEAYYAAVPYRLVLGARPFVDETTPSDQTTALLAYPFLWVYHAFFGLTGLVLFTRHLHFFLCLGIAACVYAGLRSVTRTRTEALLPALVAVAFVPFNLPDLSYNTLGAGFFAAGSFLAVRFLATGSVPAAAAAGLAHGLAVFAYPPFAAGVLVEGCVVLLAERGKRRRATVSYMAAALAPCAALVFVFADAGFGNVRVVFENARRFGDQGGGIAKIDTILGAVAAAPLRAPIGLLAMVVTLLVWRRRPRIAAVLLAAVPLLLIPITDATGLYGSLRYVSILGLLALPLFLMMRQDPTVRLVFGAVWPAAFVNGLASAWSSNNGALSFGLGFMPAAIAAMVFISRALARDLTAVEEPRRPQVAALLSAGPLIVLVVLQFAATYRDRGFGHLDARVSSGAYAGLYTTPARRRFITDMTRDLARLAPNTCSTLFYDDFPAGYLLTKSRPYTNAVWLLRVRQAKVNEYRQVLLRYYSAKRSLPDVVVRMRDVPGLETGSALTYSPHDILDRLVRGEKAFRLAATRKAYAVYYRRGIRCVRPPRARSERQRVP
jgi:hypothetical protein